MRSLFKHASTTLQSSRAFSSLKLDRSRLPKHVKIVEVGPRDGLQNEKQVVELATKVELVKKLSDAGLKYIEAGSMVSKQWVPAMGDSVDVYKQSYSYAKNNNSRLSVLVPNMKGFASALEAGAEEIAVFAAASDAFSLKNINCNVMDSLERFRPVVASALEKGILVRGYVSCVVGCPYSGPVDSDAVGFVTAALRDMGCYEISLGDTIGVGTPWSVRRMLDGVINKYGVDPSILAMHSHDTYGQGMANVSAAIDCGLSVIDASVAGLGGCPYAGGGASGNVATEDVHYLLSGLGIETGVDPDKLLEASHYITSYLNMASRSKAGAARSARLKALEKATAEGDDAKASQISVALSWPQRPPTGAVSSNSNDTATAKEGWKVNI